MRCVVAPVGIAISCLLFNLNISNAQSTRAMWVWATDSIIDNTSGAQTRLFAFCASPPGASEANRITSNQINTLYFYAHSYLNGDSTHRANLHQFLTAAHANGLKVQLLDGAPDWVTTGRSYGEQYVDYFLNFNAETTTASAKFDGLQLDVEPYLNTGWFTQTLWDGFMTLLGDTRAKIAAARQTLQFGVAAPRWYDVNPGASYLSQLQDSCDYLAIMDYVDNETSLQSDVSNEIANADAKGKFVVVGVETLPVTPTSSTFNEEGWGNLEGRMYETTKKYRLHSGFAGSAVHDYASYARLPKWGSNGLDATAPSMVDYRYDANDANGTFALHVVDNMSGGLNTTSSIYAATVKKYVSETYISIPGIWNTQTANYLKFAPSSSVDAGGTFRITTSPKDNAGNQRFDTTTITIAATPATVLPVLYATSVIHSPSLVWRSTSGATSYRLQVSRYSNFSTTLTDRSGITDTSYQVSGLSDTARYYWRVSASNLSSTSRYSTRMQFTTGLTPGTVIAATDLGARKNAMNLSANYLRDMHTATITYVADNGGHSHAELYNESGQLISVLLDRDDMAGTQSASVTIPEVRSGTYFVHVSNAEKSETTSIAITK